MRLRGWSPLGFQGRASGLVRSLVSTARKRRDTASRTDFFSAPGLLIIFSEIKDFKRPSAKESRASRVFSRPWVRCLGLSRCQIAAGRAFIFQARRLGVGIVKSLGSSSRDRVAPPHCYPQIWNLFFVHHGGHIAAGSPCGRKASSIAMTASLACRFRNAAKPTSDAAILDDVLADLGGRVDLCHSGERLPGVRKQNCEIKYKSPTHEKCSKSFS
jgi:hypothetical protein